MQNSSSQNIYVEHENIEGPCSETTDSKFTQHRQTCQNKSSQAKSHDSIRNLTDRIGECLQPITPPQKKKRHKIIVSYDNNLKQQKTLPNF